jgi:dephospho-CoA kinase
MFVRLGAELIDTDLIAREVVDPGQPALQAIRAAFGPAVFLPSGGLDRAALRRVIFADPVRRKVLDELLHPLIRARTLERLTLVTRPYAIVAVPLLVETDFAKLVDRVAVVDCSDALQLERLIRRDGVPRAEAAAAIAAQTDRATRLRAAHDVIDNSGDLELTRRQVAQLHQHYVELAARKTAGGPKK